MVYGKVEDINKNGQSLTCEIEVFEIFTLLPDLTVILHVSEFEPTAALIVTVPLFFAVTTPFESTVATEVFELLHLIVDDDFA